MPALPVHVGALWPSRESALACPRGEIELALCSNCGFVGNVRFDPAETDYAIRYDNALHYSPRFRKYEAETAQHLIEDRGICDKQVVEVGCGNGHFLGLLCELGGNRGTGFDPSYDPETSDPALQGRARVIRDYFSDGSVEFSPDLLCCRHVLEHIPRPRSFLAALRRTLREPEALLYIEVPSAGFVIRDGSVWDVIYEHCSYFTPDSLVRIVTDSAFDVLYCRETYGGQFLALEARPAGNTPPPVAASGTADEWCEQVLRFGQTLAERRRTWTDRLAAAHASGKRIALWGAGAKAVSFLNLVSVVESIAYVVDLNPAKHGSFVAGSGHPIVSPDYLLENPPDLVVVMNPIYRDEIQRDIQAMGLAPHLFDA